MIKISVLCKTSAIHNTELFKAITEFMNIEFQLISEVSPHLNSPLILLDATDEMLMVARTSELPFFAYLSPRGDSKQSDSNVVNFTLSHFLPKILRGQLLVTNDARQLSAIEMGEPFEVLAQVKELPIWVVSSHNKNQHYTSVSLPKFENDNRLCEFLNGETFLGLLPLYCFLRFCISQPNWQPPPLRACMIVDDPNLHWSSYGPINYNNLSRYCNKHNVHIAFATIPLDCWYIHPKTAKLFKENNRHLSLLVHGNNHAKGELAIPMQQTVALNYFAQSLHRIKDMERKSGLSVDFIMVPPHGLVTKSSAYILSQLGFEAICTNRWSLWKHIKPRELPSNFGMNPVVFLKDNMPVLNRFRMVSPICRNEIVIAALLGIPIIPYCHVEDFYNSFSEIEETIFFINKLEKVFWHSISEILCSNYSWFQIDEILRIKAYSKKIKIVIPDNTTWLEIESPIIQNSFGPNTKLSVFPPANNGQKEYNFGDKISVKPKQEYEISLIHNYSLNIDQLPKHSFDYHSFLRRIGTELRDRCYRLNNELQRRF